MCLLSPVAHMSLLLTLSLPWQLFRQKYRLVTGDMRLYWCASNYTNLRILTNNIGHWPKIMNN